ncbi:unnamed protein product [marine sediment metagenome]|jgi:hypothetical protein|uniref:Uncharacterized protein n=1 Tax=marine sediment metagenome TaxID=412755 RepID=X0WUS6_9ZZZZ|tara:strand:+ start:192 stop:377 length:186 start_codon:yes stop_codon:yes gene_type:complete
MWIIILVINIIFCIQIFNIYRGFSAMDTRLLIIALPLLVAATWALLNIVTLAIQQVQRLSR